MYESGEQWQGSCSWVNFFESAYENIFLAEKLVPFSFFLLCKSEKKLQVTKKKLPQKACGIKYVLLAISGIFRSITKFTPGGRHMNTICCKALFNIKNLKSNKEMKGKFKKSKI